ncbi:hypothetical protein [Albimonas pacifica]|uniref:Uncharacterized protein n=1 Tax=Albimonas pacifica TaxID=1114924 RepID=A0A1I3HI30_9RHOB|nr:hypothetical protein [Albimonas pacifica]SFI35293.1 hypothetical protein SAMN05216258_1063 [Albimonas pacifica]
MATWPASVPAALVRGYGPRVGLPAARPDFGRGYTGQVRLARRLTVVQPASWHLTPEQMRDLTLFLRDHADAWAVMPLRMVDEDDAVTTAKARVTGPVSLGEEGRGWLASAELEIAR